MDAYYFHAVHQDHEVGQYSNPLKTKRICFI
jgi:hypothetical protein